jgi:hypothetical protein
MALLDRDVVQGRDVLVVGVLEKQPEVIVEQ